MTMETYPYGTISAYTMETYCPHGTLVADALGPNERCPHCERTPPVTMSQAELIQQRLKEKGMSAYALAQQTGIASGSIYSALKHGRFVLAEPETVQAVADALDLTPDDLYNAAGRIAPDMVDWLCEHPGIVGNIREDMESEKGSSHEGRQHALLGQPPACQPTRNR